MQRSASPDITDIPPPSSEQRRPGRPRKNPVVTVVEPSITSSSGTAEGSTVKNESSGTSPTQPTKRGRGRPKKNLESTSSPVAQSSPPVSITSNVAAAVPQQPKRRGRKPKALQENVESMDTDRPETVLEEMDTSSSGIAPNLTFHMKKVLGGTEASGIRMETEEGNHGTLGSNFFSSVLKSEPSFGGGGSAGIPGLDLDDSETNITAATSANIFAAASTFNFGSAPIPPSSSIDDECKSLQQLSITKTEDTPLPVQNPENVKKEETPAEENESSKVRRSSRIKTLEEQRGPRGRRREVVSSLSESSGISRSSLSLHEDDSNSNSSTSMQCSGTSGYSSPSGDGTGHGLSSSSSAPNLLALSSSSGNGKPLKVKSRWRYSLDAESVKGSGGDSGPSDGCVVTSVADSFVPPQNLVKRKGHLAFDGADDELLEKLKKFDGIDESIYRTERKISKENRGMVCDCYLSNEDLIRGESGCSEDCLNRLLMVECGNRCPTGESCSNRRFQKKEYAGLEVFKTEKKGHGLRTLQYIPEGGFVIEYVGEVLDVPEFERRTTEYAKGNQEHFYFMALKSDAIIDATLRGNCSRFINHSCEPNCETQKWTVNGEVRIGFFAIADLQPGDEITFDYQFQRYGKKAQKCFCMTESCRGWIGEEDDEAPEETEDKEEVTREAETEEIDDTKLKPKVKVEKKKRKNVQLEDMAFREELAKLEASGLKNRNHTLTVSRLMVRAEGWDDRERLLKILINGDTPCRRLFLDYHGLRLIWSWMVDLPLPHESEGPQLIRNDVYHMLFLRALQSLPIPNKTLLLDSKVLALVEKWCSVPQVTTSVTLVKRNDVVPPADTTKKMETETTSDVAELVKVEPLETEAMDVSDIKEEPTSTAEGMQEIVEEKTWDFVPLSKSILDSWSELKEVFRIPKKERIEQMKEHEREADKGQPSSSIQNSGGLSSNYSYDRDHRNKQYRNRGERRVPVLDPTQPQFHRYSNRMIPPGVTKEQWRKHFEQSVKEREEQELLRKQQDALVNLHQERCALVGLDPATTPIVDPHGVHYLDPKTVMWKPINIDDPTMPPELIKFVQLSQYPPQSETADTIPPPVVVPVEPEQAFPPWPPGLPPPPPLPPRELPKNWKMAVDEEGRCYYYHIRTRVTRWDPPSPEEASSSESSESSSEEEEEEVEEEVDEGSPSIKKASIQTWRTKIIERAARRKKSGLVEEKIISPRADDEKGFSKEMIKENKKKALEEKLARLAMKDVHVTPEKSPTTKAEEVSKGDVALTEPTAEEVKRGKAEAAAAKKSLLKKRRKERPSGSKGSSTSKPKPPKPKPAAKQEENTESSSPIETELDLTLSQQSLDEDSDGFFSRVSAGPSRIIGSTPSMDVVMIPGLGFDGRDLEAKKKSADRAARHAAKKKALAMQKKAKEKAPAEAAATSSATSSSNSDKRVSSKEVSAIKDTFRNSIATVVVSHLNPYRKNEHIKSTDDFKHLARKITHAILLKELKHTRDVTSLEVTDSVKHKTKEYIKKFMARFPNGVYVRSPENSQTK